MTQELQSPKYPHRPIASVEILAAALGVPLDQLQDVARRAEGLYRFAKPIPKADGSVRQPLDALPELKAVHRRIKVRLLSKVIFPKYLTGSIAGRDARANADLHVGSAIVMSEDIERFFPSTGKELVRSIWLRFFGFSSEVADLLTALTTKDAAWPEGAITSSFLANLAFWDQEPKLEQLLRSRGFVYSRYVDDIAISSIRRVVPKELTRVIARVYGMMRSCGFSAKRRKHQIERSSGRMSVTKLTVNRRVALPTEERQAIRAAVHQLEQGFAKAPPDPDAWHAYRKVLGRVSRLRQFHASEGDALKKRLDTMRSSHLGSVVPPKNWSK